MSFTCISCTTASLDYGAWGNGLEGRSSLKMIGRRDLSSSIPSTAGSEALVAAVKQLTD